MTQEIFMSDTKPDSAKIPALYFDADGLGPDHVYLEVFPIRGDQVMSPAVSLRVRAGEFVMRAQIDGGYFMERAQVIALRDALNGWISARGLKRIRGAE